MATEVTKTVSSKVVQPLLTVTRQQNFSEWYREVLAKADLAEPSAVRGCMVINPWGYGIWEQIQQQMDALFKREKCCKNAYFPLFIPTEFFAAEAEHVAGFAKECAVVTHYRMKMENGKMIPDPAAKLEKPLIVRPTSETIIGDSMRQKIQSYRQLPLLLNQWCNVVRWEHETKPFLRTTEFLWQEGHCAFANEAEARANAYKMGQVYRTFMTQYCALPVILGEKSPAERFAGAVQTYCLEAMMQDGKAVQAGTSHYLGQNFAKAAKIEFTDEKGLKQLVHTTSWGVSTRLVGTLIMAHSDDDGLRVPPRLALHHAVIIPSGHVEKEKRDDYISKVEKLFENARFANRDVSVEVDARGMHPAEKNFEWIRKGVPLRLEIGAREANEETVTVRRRDQHWKEKSTVLKINELVPYVIKTLGEIQQNYYMQAEEFLRSHIREDITTLEQLQKFFSDPANIGFVKAKWGGNRVAEERLKDDFKVTIRCILSEQSGTQGTCVLTGEPAKLDVIFGKSY
ncbi:MAG: proline--tRNA ligase [Verrucomicrobiota bacterium]|nr:proline--tRNA ligase [Verrucomicrobiota bacterium]